MSTETNDIFRVGAITGPHGLKGDIKVFPTTQDPQRFLELKDVLLGDDETGDPLLPVTIERVRFFKNMVILKLKEFSHINDVERYKGLSLYVTRENATPLGEGEYYVKDLIGLTVKTAEREIGTLTNVLETGANDVYVVTRKGKKDLLFPAIKKYMLEVNIDKGYMLVELMDGLEELYQ